MQSADAQKLGWLQSVSVVLRAISDFFTPGCLLIRTVAWGLVRAIVTMHCGPGATSFVSTTMLALPPLPVFFTDLTLVA